MGRTVIYHILDIIIDMSASGSGRSGCSLRVQVDAYDFTMITSEILPSKIRFSAVNLIWIDWRWLGDMCAGASPLRMPSVSSKHLGSTKMPYYGGTHSSHPTSRMYFNNNTSVI